MGSRFVTLEGDAQRMRIWRFLHRDGRGQALIEYSLIMALIVVIVLVVLIVMGNTVKNLYCNVASAIVQ